MFSRRLQCDEYNRATIHFRESYVILSHKLMEQSRRELSRRDTASSSVLSGIIRQYSGTAVMTIIESLNIAKVQIPLRENK
jgi:hypothetical protein